MPNFSHLPNITDIYINANKLHGTIPDFDRIPTLKYLDVSNNQLEGSIPDFKNLPNLISIDVSSNNITGTIPNFSRTPDLVSFSSYENQHYGQIPNFSNCPAIRSIAAFRNQISDSLPIFILPRLTKIDLSENQICGSIPGDWTLPSVQYIDISRNRLNGTIPNNFGPFFRLKSLILAHNRISGTIPNSILINSSPVTIDLANNSFTGYIDEFISPYSSHSSFKLLRVDFSYENLILDDNQLYGEMDWRIYNYLSNVKSLSIKNNNISKINELPGLLKWTHLELSGNPIEGSIPETFSRFTKMNYLGLKDTMMKYTGSNFLPHFMNHTHPYNLEDKTKSFICPSIVSGVGAVETNINLNPDYYNHTLCQCLPNYFGFGNKCLQCPSHCECRDGLSLRKCHASPDIFDLKSILPCPRPDSCAIQIPDKNPHTRVLPTIKSQCKKGYEGRACSKCQDGYGRQGRICVECSDMVKYATLAICLLLLGLLLMCLYFSEASNSAKIRIILMHMQTLSIISTGLINSETLMNILDTSSSIGSIIIPNIGCVVGSTRELYSIGISYSRIPAFLVIGLGFHLFGSNRMKSKAVLITLNLMFFIYYSIARDVFGVFGCTVFDEGEGAWYLNYAPWIQCDPITAEYQRMVGVSGIVFMLFLVGFPLFIWVNMRSTSDNTSQNQAPPKINLEFMYLPYKENFKYWEFVIVGRRLAFSFVVSVIPYLYPTVFFLLLVVIIQASIWVQREFNPYKCPLENKMELSSLYTIFVSFFLALLSSFLGIRMWITAALIGMNAAWLVYVYWTGFVVSYYKNAKAAHLANMVTRIPQSKDEDGIDDYQTDYGSGSEYLEDSTRDVGSEGEIKEDQDTVVDIHEEDNDDICLGRVKYD